mgnify:CR=1 FL=1
MKLFASIAVIANKVKEDYVSAFAAQAALFVIMSFVPFLILLLTLIKYTPLTEEVLLQFVTNFAPDAFSQSLSSIISQLYTGSDTPLFLISLASILWTAGKGCNALIEGLNSVFDIKERRNGFVLRLYSILYTIIFVVIIVVCLLIYILGNEILSFITNHVPFVTNIIEALLNIRVLLSVGLFTVFFTFLYVAIPSRHTKIRRQLPGAIFIFFLAVCKLFPQYSCALRQPCNGCLRNVMALCMYVHIPSWCRNQSLHRAMDDGPFCR